jgi:SNF2 family DNA or RNA helicase
MKYEQIHSALKLLADRCDYASSVDGEGFNKIDSGFGKDLAGRSQLTFRQALAAHKMLKKYRGQLQGRGVDFDSIPVPSPEEIEVKPKSERKIQAGKIARLKDIKTIELVFSGDDFHKTLEQVRTLPGRKFNKDTKKWTAPASKIIVNKLISFGFTISNDVEDLFSNKPEEKIEITIPPGLELYPFQEQGVKFLLSRGSGLVADEMGLGKTVQALAFLSSGGKLPALVVCPASLKINWHRETKKWIPGAKPFIMYGRSSHDLYRDHNIIIINYDIMKKHWAELKLMNFKTIILDECHYIKNVTAQRTKFTRQIAKTIEHKICLSGTPIINKPIEIFTTLNLLEPDTWASQWQFAQRYCGAHHNGFGWDFSGASHTEELHQILTETIMVRRTKAEVLKDLPAKQRTVVAVDINNRTEYKRAEANFIKWIHDNEGEEAAIKASNAETLVQFEKLKTLAVEGKIDSIFDWIDNTLEQKSKLVVFATHHWTIDKIMERYQERAVKVDGRDSGDQRQESVDRFQSDPSVNIFVGNIKAAGVGLTLTAADTTVFLELGWTPGEHDQAEDRIHRIGQEAESVNIYYLVADETIEDSIIKILDSKRKITTKILDGKDVEDESLLKELKQKFLQMEAA